MHTQNSVAFLSTSEQSDNKIKKTTSTEIVSAIIKYLGINSCKRSVRLAHWKLQNIVERK